MQSLQHFIGISFSIASRAQLKWKMHSAERIALKGVQSMPELKYIAEFTALEKELSVRYDSVKWRKVEWPKALQNEVNLFWVSLQSKWKIKSLCIV